MNARLRLLAPLALVLEAGASWLVFSENVPAILGSVALHALASGLFGLSLLIDSGGRRLWAWPLVGWTLSLLVFPGMGMAATLVAFVLAQTVWRRRGEAAVLLEAAADMDDRPLDAVARAHEMEVALLDELEIEPLVDVLRENDPALKRAAIEAVTKQGDASSVRLLIGMLHDPVPEVRFFASVGLSRLEDQISRAILAAQHDLTEPGSSVATREYLAQLYLDYAVSGFLEGVTRDYYTDLARRTFEETLALDPQAERVVRRLAEVHLLLGNIAEAAAMLDEFARTHPDDPAVHLLRLAVIHQFGDYRELAIYARRALGAVPSDFEGHELVEWWASTGLEETAVAS